jgi:ribosomal-protein-alanine N-acetyltransferase
LEQVEISLLEVDTFRSPVILAQVDVFRREGPDDQVGACGGGDFGDRDLHVRRRPDRVDESGTLIQAQVRPIDVIPDEAYPGYSRVGHIGADEVKSVPEQQGSVGVAADADFYYPGAGRVSGKYEFRKAIITYNAHEPQYDILSRIYLRVMPLINIRPFELSDSREILEMEEAIFNEPNPLLYQMIENFPSEGFIVAEADGVLCGYLVGVIFMDEARVLLLAVKEKYRHKKIGTMLINNFIESVRGRANMVRLEVRSNNLTAQTFYFKMGFRFIGIVNNYYKNGDSAYIMVRPLDRLTLFL